MKVDTSVKKVLIFRLGSLGDTIVALPCLHLIARKFPNAERLLLTNAPLNQKAPPADLILGGSGLIHGYIRYDSRKRGGIWRKAREIRAFKPDLVVYLVWMHRSLRVAQRDDFFFRYICGARQVIGVPQEIESRRKLEGSEELYEHEAIRLARVIRPLGEASPEDLANWSLRISEEERTAAAKALGDTATKPIIVCGPGTKVQAKDWGQANWRSLIEQLSIRFPGHALVLVGSQEEQVTANYVGEGWSGGFLNLCGKLTPRETAAVLSRAELFLGPDSGPMHLAAIQGVPCAIAFSARDYAGAWYPIGNFHRILYRYVECRRCRLDNCIEQRKKCLTSITVDEMATAAIDAWRDGANARGVA